MTCAHAHRVLDTWNPADDLPDAVADHLSGCPACMDRFDALHPPVPLAHLAAAAPGRRDLRPVLAAAALVLIAVGATFATAEPDPAAVAAAPAFECPIEVEPLLPEECPV